MAVLDCSVTGCAYNQDACCCRSDIKVEGKTAKQTGDTRCGSFRERKGSVENSTGCATKETTVSCDACHCAFNDDCRCTAEHIGIAGGNACTCKDTECASFECC